MATLVTDSDGKDNFVHGLAIKLSRVMNLINPNDLLARRVIDIAKNNSLEAFVKGLSSCLSGSPLLTRYHWIASKGFGNFKDSFLTEIHSEILSHAKQEANGHVPQPVKGITITDSDVLEPEPVRQGGLVRMDAVCTFTCISRSCANMHTLSPATYLPYSGQAG